MRMIKAKKAYYNEAYGEEWIRKNPIQTLTMLSQILESFYFLSHQTALNLLSSKAKNRNIEFGEGIFTFYLKNKFTAS